MRALMFVLTSAFAFGCGGASKAQPGPEAGVPSTQTPEPSAASSREIAPERGVRVELPGEPREAALSEALVVSIGFDGALYLEGEKTDREALAEAMKEAAGKDPEARVVVQADPQVEHGRVIEVMEIGKGAGLRNFAIALPEPERGAESGD